MTETFYRLCSYFARGHRLDDDEKKTPKTNLETMKANFYVWMSRWADIKQVFFLITIFFNSFLVNFFFFLFYLLVKTNLFFSLYCIYLQYLYDLRDDIEPDFAKYKSQLDCCKWSMHSGYQAFLLLNRVHLLSKSGGSVDQFGKQYDDVPVDILGLYLFWALHTFTMSALLIIILFMGRCSC